MTEQLLRSLQEKFTSGSLRPNELDNSGLSLIHQAASDGQLTCLKWLLKYGGDPNLRSKDGSVPAHYAAGGGHLSVLLYLFERANGSISEKNKNGATPLYVAAQEGQLDCLIWLTKTSSTLPNAQTDMGMTPAHVAAQEGRFECLRYLLKVANVPADIKDKYGCVLLHYAAAEGHWKITNWLMEHCGMNGEEQDISGATALHVAAKAGREKVAQYLLKGGVSPDMKDFQDKTALDYAFENDQFLCVSLLKEVTSYNSVDLKKKVRFSESVFAYDTSTLPNRKNTFGNRYKRKERHKQFMDDDFQSQFDLWRSSPKTKRKRERREKPRGLYNKGRSEYLLNKIPDVTKKTVKSETNISLDEPDILKHLNTKNEKVLRNLPPTVPVRNGVPILPKQSPYLGSARRAKVTPAERVQINHSNTPKNSNFIPNNSPIDISVLQSPRDFPDIPAYTSSPRHPPKVPIRQNRSNIHALNQSSNMANDVKFPKTSPEQKQLFVPASTLSMSENNLSLSTVSPELNPQYRNQTKDAQDRPSYDATNYVPNSFINKKIKLPTEKWRYRDATSQNFTNGHSLKDKPSFTNHLWDLDMGITAQTEQVNYFSNNMISQHRKASTWSTIRQGFSTIFNSIRQKKVEQNNPLTWPATRRYPQREDIFSRFSIPNKSRKEFDDLFNSSLEGSYTTYSNNNYSGFITTPSTENRKLTSLQSGYNATELARFKTRALDNSLKGKSDFVSEIDTTKSSINSYMKKPNVKTREKKEKVNAFIW